MVISSETRNLNCLILKIPHTIRNDKSRSRKVDKRSSSTANRRWWMRCAYPPYNAMGAFVISESPNQRISMVINNW